MCGKLVMKLDRVLQAGFGYHHAEPAYLMLTLWLPDGPCTLPLNASHQVGVGAFVLNDKNEVSMLLIYLKYYDTSRTVRLEWCMNDL